MSDGPTDSAVVFTATPKRHPKIYDDDDDDEPLATPQGQKLSAAKRDVTATKRRRGRTAARKPSNRTRQSKTKTKPVRCNDVVAIMMTDFLAGIRP